MRQKLYRTGDEVQRDYVAQGSPEHAALLGLKKAEKDDTLVVDGWTLADLTAWGPAATREFLMATLRSKVAQLTAPHIEIQSDDPRKPGYHPPLWTPSADPTRRTRGIV